MEQKDFFKPSEDCGRDCQHNLKLEQFFEISPNLLCVMSREGTLLRVNDSWERTLGFSKEDYLGKNIKHFIVSEENTPFLGDPNGTKSTTSFVNRLICADGSLKSFEWSVMHIHNLIYAIGRDVTKIFELEMITDNQSKQFELVLQGSNDGIWDWNIITGEVYFSQTWKKQLGYMNGELENTFDTLYFLMHRDDKEAFMSYLNKYLNSSLKAFDIKYRMKHKDGEYRWIWARGASRRDHNGKAYRMAGSHTDITETKELIKRSLERELYLKTILDTVQDGFVVVRNNRITDANDVFLRMSGYTREDLLSLQISDLVAEESTPEYFEIRERLYNVGHVFVEITGKKKDGSKLYVEVAATALSEEFLTVLFIRNITDRKNVQKKLLDFHELLRYIIEYNLLAVSVHDKNANYMYVSQSYIELFDLQGKEIIGKNLYDVQSRMPPAYREVHQRVLKGEIIRRDETNSVFNNGRYVRWECRPWYEQAGSIGGFVLYIEDITERTLIEKLLMNEKEQFKTTLLSVGDGVISTDDMGKITVMNPIAEKLTGCTYNEAAGSPLNDVFRIINEQSRIPDSCSILSVMEKGEVIELSNKLLISKTGKEVPVEVSMAPIKHGDGKVTGVVIVLRDVTEKRAEQRQIEFLSYNDALTGLYNRRYVEDILKQIDMPENLPLALFSIDVNGLKLTNDAFGHKMGDQLLKTVAGILKMVCGSEHIIGRMGGDEFCILMKRTSDEQAEDLKEKILKEISNLKLYPVVVSLAIGYAIKYTMNEDIKLVMTISDNRMYQDKIKYGKIMRSQTIQMALQNLSLNYGQEEVHAEKVSDYCEAIAKAMNFSDQEIKDIKTCGTIHDIGKIMVPPQVINKPGKLTEEELYLVRRHPEIGYQMLKMVEEYAHLAEYILYHHERWDGAGYPVGIKGEKIPLVSRIIAIAEAFEVMTAARPYKKAMTKEEAIEELKRNAGAQFDPELVKIFVEKAL